MGEDGYFGKEQPVERTRRVLAGEEAEVETHPAFGLIGISRTQGNIGKLFGSHLNNHMGSIVIRIQRAERQHSLSSDRYFGTNRGEMFMIEMSHTQFAEMITTMNVGDGVPCTFRRMDGKAVPRIPQDMETEQEKVGAGFKREMEELGDKMEKSRQKVDEILAKKTISKEDRKAIRWAFQQVMQEVESNWPFVLDRFTKSTEKIVKAAKGEVDGFLTGALTRLGLDSLKKSLTEGKSALVALTPGEEGEEDGDKEA
jgi:hypothetical protein